MRYNMRFLFLVIMLLSAAITSGCFSKISKTKVSVRNSTTHEPIIGAKVSAHCPAYGLLKTGVRNGYWDMGISDENGVAILNLVEAELLFYSIYPFYNNESGEMADVYWEIRFKHPAITGNTSWMKVNPNDYWSFDHEGKITDPKIEIKIEKLLENKN